MSDLVVSHDLSTITVAVPEPWVARVHVQFLGDSLRRVDVDRTVPLPQNQRKWASCPSIPDYTNIPDGKWDVYQISDGGDETTSTVEPRSNDTNCGMIPGEDPELHDSYVMTGPFISGGPLPNPIRRMYFFAYKHLHSGKYHYTNIIIELVNDGGG